MRQGRTSAPSGQEMVPCCFQSDLLIWPWRALASAQALGQVSAVGRRRTSSLAMPAPSAPHDWRAILVFGTHCFSQVTVLCQVVSGPSRCLIP